MKLSKEIVLHKIKQRYFKEGYFLSGSLFPLHVVYDLRKFEATKEEVTTIFEELEKDGKLVGTKVLGGVSYTLKGETREKLINDFKLLDKWKELSKNRIMLTHTFQFEKELEFAKNGIINRPELYN